MKIALLDIDHTISDAAWRDHLLGQWDEYHAAAPEDKPIDSIVELVHALHEARWYLCGLTTRPEKWRQITMEWLLKHKIPMDELLMRANDDYRSSAESKVAAIQAKFPNLNEVTLIIDDNIQVIEAFRALGLTALQTYAGA